MTRKGYLQGSKSSAQAVADLISSYTVTSTSASRRRLSTGATTSVYPVTTAVSGMMCSSFTSCNPVNYNSCGNLLQSHYFTLCRSQVSGLVQGAQLGMASGEAPISLVTPNMQVVVTSSLVTSVGNSILTTPATASQAAYGSIQPKIIIGSAGLGGCQTSGGYVQLSVLQWGLNPFADSKSVKTPLLRFSSTSPATVKSAGLLKQSVESISYDLPGIPAYYIAMQFSSIQSFNFSASKSNTATSKSASNFTLPACTQYNGVKYIPCKSCNISTYTNYNVTYSCYDSTQLCPLSSVKVYSQDREYESMGVFISVSDDDDDDGEQGYERIEHERDKDDLRQTPSRFLLADDDNTAVSTSTSTSTYGMLLETVLGELSSVLSSNPFALNLAKSTTVLSLVGCLGGFIILMLIYLLRLDNNERLHKIYVRKERDAVARNLLETDLKNGGKGDLDASYQLHVRDISHEVKAEKSIVSTIRRQSVLLAGKSPRRQSTAIEVESGNIEESHYDINSSSHSNTAGNAARNYHKVTALIMEFLHRLFPGRTIFVEKNNIMKIMILNHDYCKMLAGSTLAETRTIRFLNLVCVVLVAIFIDTVFFGIYFPPESTCTVLADKVTYI